MVGDDPYLIVDHLQDAAPHGEPVASQAERTGSEQCDHRGVTGEDTEIAVERGRADGFDVALEDDTLWRHDRDVQWHYCFSFSAFATTSSIEPAMKNACSGRLSNSPFTKRSNEEIVSSIVSCLPLMPVNCSATSNGCDMNR